MFILSNKMYSKQGGLKSNKTFKNSTLINFMTF